MKMIVSISMDPEIWQIARETFGNRGLSSTIQDLLIKAIGEKTPENKEVISLIQLKQQYKKDIDKLKSTKERLSSEVQRKRDESDPTYLNIKV